jgi:hypothetical protein
MNAQQRREELTTLSEDIADMTKTALRIAERDGWDSPLYYAISRDIAKWRAHRARIAGRQAA